VVAILVPVLVPPPLLVVVGVGGLGVVLARAVGVVLEGVADVVIFSPKFIGAIFNSAQP
jgi:hypothetical protein